MHLFSDASPVTGQEIQGMVLQIVFGGRSVRDLILPGSILPYNGCSIFDKAIALLWALYLVFGADFELLSWVFSKIKSITTDMGENWDYLIFPIASRYSFGGWVVDRLMHFTVAWT